MKDSSDESVLYLLKHGPCIEGVKRCRELIFLYVPRQELCNLYAKYYFYILVTTINIYEVTYFYVPQSILGTYCFLTIHLFVPFIEWVKEVDLTHRSLVSPFCVFCK